MSDAQPTNAAVDETIEIFMALLPEVVEILNDGLQEIIRKIEANEGLMARIGTKAGIDELIRDKAAFQEYKKDKSFVTAGEKAVEELLAAALPEHIGFMGEETKGSENVTGKSAYLSVDPVDGTSILMLLALYLASPNKQLINEFTARCGASYAVLDENFVPRFGTILEFEIVDRRLAVRNTLTGGTGRTTKLNGKIAKLADPRPLTKATVATTAIDVMFATDAQRRGYSAVADQAKAICTEQNCVGMVSMFTEIDSNEIAQVDAFYEGDDDFYDTAAITAIALGTPELRVADHEGNELAFDTETHKRLKSTTWYRFLVARHDLFDEILDTFNSGVAHNYAIREELFDQSVEVTKAGNTLEQL